MKQSAAVAFSASPLVGFGALQMLGTGAAPQWSGIVDDFLSPRFWLTILIMLVGGAFGGMAYELLLRGGAIELPHRVREEEVGRKYTHAPADTLIALGILGRGLVGAAAAVTILMVTAPTSAHAAIALSVTSGAAAPALIRLMRRQLMIVADVLGRAGRSERSSSSSSARNETAPSVRGREAAAQPA